MFFWILGSLLLRWQFLDHLERLHLLAIRFSRLWHVADTQICLLMRLQLLVNLDKLILLVLCVLQPLEILFIYYLRIDLITAHKCKVFYEKIKITSGIFVDYHLGSNWNVLFRAGGLKIVDDAIVPGTRLTDLMLLLLLMKMMLLRIWLVVQKTSIEQEAISVVRHFNGQAERWWWGKRWR